jgi:hypothetical protein
MKIFALIGLMSFGIIGTVSAAARADVFHCEATYLYNEKTNRTVISVEEKSLPVTHYVRDPSKGTLHFSNALHDIQVDFTARREYPKNNPDDDYENAGKSIAMEIKVDNRWVAKPAFNHDYEVDTKVDYGPFNNYRIFFGDQKLDGKVVNTLSLLCFASDR